MCDTISVDWGSGSLKTSILGVIYSRGICRYIQCFRIFSNEATVIWKVLVLTSCKRTLAQGRLFHFIEIVLKYWHIYVLGFHYCVYILNFFVIFNSQSVIFDSCFFFFCHKFWFHVNKVFLLEKTWKTWFYLMKQDIYCHRLKIVLEKIFDFEITQVSDYDK